MSKDVIGELHLEPSALVANYQLCQKIAARSDVHAVVKCNAYGTGLAVAAPILWQAGCRDFFVATLAEGVALRRILRTARIDTATITVLGGLFAQEVASLCTYQLYACVNAPEQIPLWQELHQTHSNFPGAYLHIDTGMNRTGVHHQWLAQQSADAFTAPPLGLLSHLASADDPESPQSSVQRQRFAAVCAQFPGIPASLSATAGLLLGTAYHFDFVRPGIGLYGGNPGHGQQVFQPVMSCLLPIIQINAIGKGESVGYSATYKAPADMRVVTVSGGYGDGILRRGSNRIRGWCNGHYMPQIGHISMDSTCFAVPATVAHDQKAFFPGAMVEIFGTHIPVAEYAENAGTCVYEALTSIGASGRRFRRVSES